MQALLLWSWGLGPPLAMGELDVRTQSPPQVKAPEHMAWAQSPTEVKVSMQHPTGSPVGWYQSLPPEAEGANQAKATWQQTSAPILF